MAGTIADRRDQDSCSPIRLDRRLAWIAQRCGRVAAARATRIDAQGFDKHTRHETERSFCAIERD